MKKISLILALLIITGAGFAQDCPVITSADIITTGPGTYQLKITYTADGQKHIQDSVFSGNTLIFGDCIEIRGSGTYTVDFTVDFTASGVPSAVLLPGTGTCVNGTTCGTRLFICPSCGPMPVTLSDFAAQRKSSNVVLSWKTEMQLNFSHFEILRAYDNFNFEKIGSVENVSGNSNTAHSYSFIDNSNTSASVIYYRLRMVDIDGKVSFSEIRTIKAGNSAKTIVVFPNPAVSNSTVTVSGITEPSLIQILDNSGRLLKSTTLSSSNTIDLSGIQRGNYIMMIKGKTSGQTSAKKLTVVN